MDISNYVELAKTKVFSESKIDLTLLKSKVNLFYKELRKHALVFNDKPQIKEALDPRKLSTQHYNTNYQLLNYKVSDILESYSIKKYTENTKTQEMCLKLSLELKDMFLPISHNFRKIILIDKGIELSTLDKLYFEIVDIVSDFCFYDKAFYFSRKQFAYVEEDIWALKYPEWFISKVKNYTIGDYELFEKITTHSIKNDCCETCSTSLHNIIDKRLSCNEGKVYSILE